MFNKKKSSHDIFRKMVSTRNLKKAYRKYAKEKKRAERKAEALAREAAAYEACRKSIVPYEELEPSDTIKIAEHKSKGMPWVEVIKDNGRTTRIWHYEGQANTCDDEDLKALDLLESELPSDDCNDSIDLESDDYDEDEDDPVEMEDPNAEYWARVDAEEEAEREALYDEIGPALSGFIAGIS